MIEASPILLPIQQNIKHNYNFKDLTGQIFGRLRVLGAEGVGQDRQYYWRCACSCGKTVVVSGHNLRRGQTRSCTCFQKDRVREMFTVHGHARVGPKISEYGIWCSMKRRCLNSNEDQFKDYGGRGITICERWLNSFENFLADMGRRPSKRHTIDRINNDGNYEPGNCRWATRLEQNNNARSNIRITHNGKTQTVAQWAREFGIKYKTLLTRIHNGVSIELALIPPC